MNKTKYKYILFDLDNHSLPAYVGTAKDIADKIYVDKSNIHKAAKK